MAETVETTIPVYIIAFNNLHHVKNFVEQLEKFTANIHIIDNCSTYPKLLEYYKNDYKYNLIKMDRNYGHEVYMKLYDELPEQFIISDPDLQLNENTPEDFIDQLALLSEKYKIWKTGLALDISQPELFINGIYHAGKTIKEWESQFWTKQEDDVDYEVYDAHTDTTFCLCNKKYYQASLFTAIRIADNFTCKHLPWYKSHWKEYPTDEIKFYKEGHCSTMMKMVIREGIIE